MDRSSSSKLPNMVRSIDLPALLVLTFVISLTQAYQYDVNDNTHDATEYQYDVRIDPKGHFLLQWSVDYSAREVRIKLRAKVTPRQWFAFGFSDSDDVTNADLQVFWTDHEKRSHFVDGHTDVTGVLHVDRRQNYHVTSLVYTPGGVSISFRRRFDTCDHDDYAFDNGTTHIVYIESPQSWPGGSHVGVNMLGLPHGVQRVQLLKPEVPAQRFPEDTWTFEIRNPDIEVPDKETTYWWHRTMLPSIIDKHHIIRYEGVIAPGNEDIVHHMEVFHCQVKAGESVPQYSGPGLAEGKPPGLKACRKVIGAWAMGAKAMIYPGDAGVPVGGSGYSRFVLLEVHYNNPSRIAGRIDSSGVRFYVTSHLRPQEAGIMELGLTYTNKMAAPPGQSRWPLTGYCVAECTREGLPPTGIHVFASQLHTHLTGRRASTRLTRKGAELQMLNEDRHYSPHFQEIRRLEPPVLVKPGDALITTCEYDTRSRSNVTVGGFSISDEMCVNYIHYFPASQLEVCKSSVETKALEEFFHRYNVSSAADVRESYHRVPWSPATISSLSLLYATAPLAAECLASDGTQLAGRWGSTAKPELQWRRAPEQKLCSARHRKYGAHL